MMAVLGTTVLQLEGQQHYIRDDPSSLLVSQIIFWIHIMMQRQQSE
jgi:hypothetical protein